MRNKSKYLGINQPIPYKVLEEVVFYLLKGQVMSKEHIIRHLQEYIKGENRIGKAYNHINTIIASTENIILNTRKHITSESYFKLSNEDRLAMIICLISLTFPVTYEILNVLASGFKVQSKINKAYINQKLMASYGSNRGIYNAIGSVLPMLVEYGILNRYKIGVYELATQKEIQNDYLNEMYAYADIKLSESKSILLDDIDHRPWYLYFKIHIGKNQNIGLIKYTESRIGHGYLMV